MKIRVSLIVLLALVAVALLLSGAGLSAGQSGSPSGESPPPATGELEEFVPSERVPADSAISFPVDI